MRGKPVHIFLDKRVKAAAFGQYPPNVLMASFQSALLVRTAGVTIENTRTQGTVQRSFKGIRVRKFRAVIGEQNGKQRAKEVSPCFLFELINNVAYRLGVIVLAKKDQQESRLGKIEGQHTGAADPSNDCIDLYNRRIRVLLHIQ